MPATFQKGDLVRCTGTFTTQAGVAQDPTAVNFAFTNPAGTTTTYTYGTHTQLVRSSTGVFYVDVDASSTGLWHGRWYATGTGQAAVETKFYVESAF